MKQLNYLALITMVLFQLSCVSYKKEIYRSDSSLNKGSEIIGSLKVGDRVKVGLKNGEKLIVTIIMHDDKEIYGSTNPVGETFNKIILFEQIEYVKIREPDNLKTIGIGLLALPIIIFMITNIFPPGTY